MSNKAWAVPLDVVFSLKLLTIKMVIYLELIKEIWSQRNMTLVFFF